MPTSCKQVHVAQRLPDCKLPTVHSWKNPTSRSPLSLARIELATLKLACPWCPFSAHYPLHCTSTIALVKLRTLWGNKILKISTSYASLSMNQTKEELIPKIMASGHTL
ncbi:hypothetical protein AG1IA_07289 [Rhizoctonia solani AG-1 IA]|uniref:Uncharacterized protein n=1 Tax=Thanatephorus cucumeris (strain AG1-IA) TaxID=983506 RepID=L8WPI9_THACA|nr:hypothetical protein AG1IA_07289 [Rhizoctonia solani AG-1 IA]